MSSSLIVFLVIILSILVLIYIVYAILLTSGTGTKKKKDLQISKKGILEQANLLFNQKKYKVVEKLAKKYLEIKPEHSELRTLLAKALYNDENVYEAVKECLILLQKDENNSEVKLLLARCYKKVGQQSKAITEFQDIIAIEPDNLIAIKELSEIYLETNQKVSAIKMLQKQEELIENNQELMQVKSILADLYIEMENYPEAFDELNEILEIYPEDVETHKKLIELYTKVQNYESAIENCEKMLDVNENNSLSLWILNNLVNLYYLIKNIEKTMVYAQKLLEHPFSDKVKTKTYIAKILIASGKEEEGMEILKNLSDNNKGNIEVKRLMINTYIKDNKFVPAIDLYKEIIDLVGPLEVKNIHNEMSNTFVLWAKHLFNKREINECFKIFTLAVQYDNSNPEVYYELGLVNSEIKNYNESILQLKKAINIAPDIVKYHLALADCYGELGNTFEQKDSLINAVKLDEKNTGALFKLAKLYNSQHDKTNEIKTLEQIIEMDSNHLDAKYQLALLLESQGNVQEALKLYKEIESYDYEYKNVHENIEMLSSKMQENNS